MECLIMGRCRIFIGLLLVAAMAGTVEAAVVSVTNYNWLQMRPERVTSFVTGQTGGGNGFGHPDDFRWGDFVWIPDAVFTNSGAADYFAGLTLDTTRQVKDVKVQWWASEGTSIRQFTVQGSTDGSTWANIGTHDFGTFKTGHHGAFPPVTVDVTDGTYRHVRLRIATGDYTPGNTGTASIRGGPGLMVIEPIGDGSLPEEEVNWANKPNFNTAVSNAGFSLFNGTRYNDGSLFDDEGVRTGEGPGSGSTAPSGWDAGSHVQIDLLTARQIGRAIVVWDFVWNGNAFNVLWSNDGTNFFAVPGQAPPSQLAGTGATQVVFQPVTARYFRIADASGNPSHVLLNQVLLMDLPEPSGLGLLALAAVAVARGRRRT